jgi:hypothetical protein
MSSLYKVSFSCPKLGYGKHLKNFASETERENFVAEMGEQFVINRSVVTTAEQPAVVSGLGLGGRLMGIASGVAGMFGGGNQPEAYLDYENKVAYLPKGWTVKEL